MSYFTDKINAALVLEDTSGTYKAPQASDMVFPLGADIVTPDLQTTEGVKDALGKHSQPRRFPQKISATTTLYSSLMEAADATSATGAIEVAPLFQMGGFNLDTWDDNGTTKLSLVYDGNGNCETVSAIIQNLGCGDASTGYGYQLRGMRAAVEIMAETAGSEIKVNLPVTAAVQAESRTLTPPAKVYANGAATANTEMFLGAFTLDGVATPIEKFSVSMNPTQKVKSSPSSNFGVSSVTSTAYDTSFTITCPVGSETDGWWTNATTGAVIPLAAYLGTYVNMSWANLSVKSHNPEDGEGEVVLTQELSFETFRIDFK